MPGLWDYRIDSFQHSLVHAFCKDISFKHPNPNSCRFCSNYSWFLIDFISNIDFGWTWFSLAQPFCRVQGPSILISAQSVLLRNSRRSQTTCDVCNVQQLWGMKDSVLWCSVVIYYCAICLPFMTPNEPCFVGIDPPKFERSRHEEGSKYLSLGF